MTISINTKTFTLTIKFCTQNKKLVTSTIRKLSAKQLIYTKFGEPKDVLHITEYDIPTLSQDDVLVRMLAAPVNPADINTIQGKYPVKIRFPSIPGNEGVGIVNEVGPEVKSISVGNKVIMAKPGLGTWRDLAVFHETDLRVVPDCLGIVEAATLNVNPCTAYRMLSDFVPVRQNRLVVIQNGANSACGQNVIQICRAWQVPTVNIVRQRPEIHELKNYLYNLGADYVFTEHDLKITTVFKEGKIDKPSLALNCVGGKSVIPMLKHMQHSATVVTYGGMSKLPVTIPTSAFIFKNICFKGFWITAWSKKASMNAQECMLSEIINMMCECKIVAPMHKLVKFENYNEAIRNALSSKGFTGNKYLLEFGFKA